MQRLVRMSAALVAGLAAHILFESLTQHQNSIWGYMLAGGVIGIVIVSIGRYQERKYRK